MSFSADLACFEAKAISLRRGRRSIWEEANWRIQGPYGDSWVQRNWKKFDAGHAGGSSYSKFRGASFSMGENQISPDSWMTQIALAAPWAEVPSHLTLSEAIAFHGRFDSSKGDLHWMHFREGWA